MSAHHVNGVTITQAMRYTGTYLTLFVGGPADRQFVMANVALDTIEVLPLPDRNTKPTDRVGVFQYVRREHVISGYAYIYYALSIAGIDEEPDDLVQMLSRGRHYGPY